VEPSHPHRSCPRPTLILVAFPAIAVFFLLSEHRAGALGLLPNLLLACPLLHFFHHGRRGILAVASSHAVQIPRI
jgi:Protein of unknown function (DUF2933)